MFFIGHKPILACSRNSRKPAHIEDIWQKYEIICKKIKGEVELYLKNDSNPEHAFL